MSLFVSGFYYTYTCICVFIVIAEADLYYTYTVLGHGGDPRETAFVKYMYVREFSSRVICNVLFYGRFNRVIIPRDYIARAADAADTISMCTHIIYLWYYRRDGNSTYYSVIYYIYDDGRWWSLVDRDSHLSSLSLSLSNYYYVKTNFIANPSPPDVDRRQINFSPTRVFSFSIIMGAHNTLQP